VTRPADCNPGLIYAARSALELLDTYGPDDEQDDPDFVAVRARLRQALDAEAGHV
jgi:hypothetical protein